MFNRSEAFILFAGDLALFFLSLWVTLALRYAEVPEYQVFTQHLAPFSILFILWVLVFFIAGLYEEHTLILQKRLPNLLFHSVVANSIIAVLFFYFIPNFSITPKVNLFIYLFVSFVLILLWRWYRNVFFGSRERENAVIIGSGEELRELEREINHNPRYHIRFILAIDVNKIAGMDIAEELVTRIYAEEVRFVVVDLRSDLVEPILPHLYNLLFLRIRFLDFYKVYENIFGRIPLSLVHYNWFLEHISAATPRSYDMLKRIMDIAFSLPFLLLSLLCYPFIMLAIKLDDGGAIFIAQERIGKGGGRVRTFKFRSMERNEPDPTRESDNRVTRVGRFLRRFRLDEMPQLLSVLRGDFSLIGPRPELPSAVRHYSGEIPYYHVRHLIKPGLSGWAQMYHERHPHHRTDVSETKIKLSYDLYYIKNRSFILDVKIALKTVKVLLSRSGA